MTERANTRSNAVLTAAKITSKRLASSGPLSGLWLYGWQQASVDEDDGTLTYPDGTREGVVTDDDDWVNPALSLNNAELDVDTEVWIKARGSVADQIVFEVMASAGGGAEINTDYVITDNQVMLSSDGSWVDMSLTDSAFSLILPAGRYHLRYKVGFEGKISAMPAGFASVTTRLYDATAAVVLEGSVCSGLWMQATGVFVRTTGEVTVPYTCSVTSTVRIEAIRNGGATWISPTPNVGLCNGTNDDAIFTYINLDSTAGGPPGPEGPAGPPGADGTGTVDSVDVSGGTTGLTTSGGPVTGSGTITLGGTLAVGSGGTGSTTTGGARTALGLAIGTNVQAWDTDLDAIAALASTAGMLSRTGAGAFAVRTLTAPAAGITVSNPTGAAGNPTLVLADDLAALEALSGTDTIYYRSGSSTWSALTVGTGLSFSGGTLSASGGGGGGSPGGSSGDVQTNDGSGGFAGSSSLHWNGSTLTISGDLSAGIVTHTSAPAFLTSSAMTLGNVIGYVVINSSNGGPSGYLPIYDSIS